jgi:hypothetical protein
MVKGLLANTGSLFWNLSADVGPGQPNRPDDVEFVRFGYIMLRDNPKATADMAPDIYPRIDLHPRSGPAVTASVRKICLLG